MKRKIALATWNSRLSPVFDTAKKLLIVDVENGSEVARTEENIEETVLSRRVKKVSQVGVNVLLCGAISKPLAEMLIAAGIVVIPFLAGEVETILTAYLEGKLPNPQFLMPGCYGGRGRKLRRRYGRQANIFNRGRSR